MAPCRCPIGREATLVDYTTLFVPTTALVAQLAKRHVEGRLEECLTLHGAASIAGLLITTEAMVAEKPEKSGEPAMSGAGMDGMGF